MSDLSIVCVTKFDLQIIKIIGAIRGYAEELGAQIIYGVDGGECTETRYGDCVYTPVQSNGCIESVLDEVLALATRKWVLRIDDDETLSPAFLNWLRIKEYEKLGSDVYAFPRVHLWGDTHHYIDNPPLYPDVQTRLTTKDKAGGRKTVHAGSPHGTGKIIWRALEHHKFLVRNQTEREEIARRYESIQPGAGTGHYGAFSLPEKYFSELSVKEYDGYGNFEPS